MLLRVDYFFFSINSVPTFDHTSQITTKTASAIAQFTVRRLHVSDLVDISCIDSFMFVLNLYLSFIQRLPILFAASFRDF